MFIPSDEDQRGEGCEELTNDCHVGGLGQGKEGWSDGDLAEIGSSQLGLHRVQHHSDVVRGRHLNREHHSQYILSHINPSYND